MKKQEIERIKDNLSKYLEKYISIIIEEYKEYISQEDIERLKKITNYKEKIIIEETGTISCFVKYNKIYFPLLADKILRKTKLLPVAHDKTHKAYNEDNIIINENTFTDYVKHLIKSKATAEDYYIENLLHESMHFCGSGGANPLTEGLTEYNTRKLAKKYNLKTTGCGYPKEVKIVHELENLFGEKAMNIYLFDRSGVKSTAYIMKENGADALKLITDIKQVMDKEFDEKYYRKINEYGGLTGPLKKIKAYDEIDYSEVYELINAYKNKVKEKELNKEQEESNQEQERPKEEVIGTEKRVKVINIKRTKKLEEQLHDEHKNKTK